MSKEFKLKVAEAHEDYIGKNIITLDISVKQSLGVISGDIIEINGGNKTAAQVWPEKHSAENQNIIRMDQYIRKNADVSIGDIVTIKKINPDIAHKIELTPLKQVNLLSENQDLIIKKNFLGRPFVEKNTVMINIFGTGYFYKVTSTKPSGIVVLSDETELIIHQKPSSKLKAKTIIGYEDVGGLKKEIEKIREMVELPFKYPELFNKLNVTPPKGILLYGPPGTGKTLLAKALSNELKATFISVDAPQIIAKYVGEAEERLRQIFKKAQANSPAIIFIDEIDAITPKRDSFASELEKRVVAQLLALMDGMSTKGDVIIIGATNRAEDIDSALRRPGRFDREINISVPDVSARQEILKIHTRNVPLNKNVNIKSIAEKTHGFVGADLSALVKEAAILSIKKTLEDINYKTKKEIPLYILEKLKINNENFEQALKIVQPSALREIFVDIPKISFKDVGALKNQKDIIKDIVILSLKNKDVLDNMNISSLKKLLFYGPPGTGKTMLVKAIAREYGINFIYIKGPEIFNKWVGESEKAIRKVFKKAKDVSPCILFFDEIDSLTVSKGEDNQNTKVLDQLLTELDNIGDKDILFFAATNRPDLIDKSFLRSGRIDKIIEFTIPNKKERKEIIDLLLNKTPHTKIDTNSLADKTNGFTGADINLLITDAALLALKENKYKLTKVKEEHIDRVYKKMRPNIAIDNNQIYNSFKSDTAVAKYVQ